MINKAEGDWGRLEDVVRSGTTGDSRDGDSRDGDSLDREAVLKGIAGVRDVLKRMCQVSVTRSSLREAVREAILPILQEHREDLFPEIAELRELRDLASARATEPNSGPPAEVAGLLGTNTDTDTDTGTGSGDVARRLEDFEARVQRLARLEDDVERSFEAFGSRLTRVDGRVDEVSGRLDSMATGLRSEAKTAGGEAENAASERLAALDDRLSAVAARLARFAEGKTASDALLSESGTRLDEFDSRLGDLDGTVASLGERVVGSESHSAEAAARLERAEAGLTQAGERLDAVDKNSTALAGRVEWVESEAAAQVEALQRQLTDVEARLRSVDERMRAVGGRVDAVEQTLRKELEEMVQGLANQLVELREILSRVDTTLLETTGPQRQAIQAVQMGLGELEDRLESRFGRMTAQVAQVAEKVEGVTQDVGRVSAGVDHIDALTPELRSLAGRFTEVRQGLQAVAGKVGESDRDVLHLKDTVTERLGELKRLVHEGIERWEEDQSNTTERLSGLRDTLRDQLNEVSVQFKKTQKSLLGKVMRKEPGLKLSRGEWDQLSGKIEDIVSGLEGILAKKRER